MRRMIVCFVALGLAAAAGFAEAPRGKAELTLNGTTMTIEYRRPSLKGRDVLAKAPPGTVWRLGADQETMLTLTGPAVFGNMVVSKGEYSLFAERVSEDRWSLIVNRETGRLGTERDPSKDLLAIPLKWEKAESPVEELEIELGRETDETGIFTIQWGEEVLKQRFRLPAVPSP